MPTGWEVTLDLVRKLATVHNETCGSNPELWYLQKFGVPPDYSDLLAHLVKTSAERQQLLRRYWEANTEEREENKKQPTVAHRAIADLAASNFVKVIVTTNFDHLMEAALRNVGVNPTVLSSAEQIRGALPLVHTRCCVFKVHGDYLDPNIRNTEEELSEYPEEVDRFLDEVFDNFGLIVCGWSAEWDIALRQALFRARSRRFSTYWAVRGKLGNEAQQLVVHRKSEVVRIENADSFFSTLQQSVEAIDEFAPPHPLSTAVAIASIKRYLVEPTHRIRLTDLVRRNVDEVVELTSEEHVSIEQGPLPTNESTTERLRRYDAVCSTLLSMAAVGAAWAESDHHQIWRTALERLGRQRANRGGDVWLDLQRYPATLLLYALGIGALTQQKFSLVEDMFTANLINKHKGTDTAVSALPPLRLVAYSGPRRMQMLEGVQGHTPLSDWIHGVLTRHVKDVIPDEDQYTLAFDLFEVLMALRCARGRQSTKYWAPVGAFVHRTDNQERVLRRIEESLTLNGGDSPFVTSGLMGPTASAGMEAIQEFRDFVSRAFPWL